MSILCVTKQQFRGMGGVIRLEREGYQGRTGMGGGFGEDKSNLCMFRTLYFHPHQVFAHDDFALIASPALV